MLFCIIALLLFYILFLCYNSIAIIYFYIDDNLLLNSFSVSYSRTLITISVLSHLFIFCSIFNSISGLFLHHPIQLQPHWHNLPLYWLSLSSMVVFLVHSSSYFFLYIVTQLLVLSPLLLVFYF